MESARACPTCAAPAEMRQRWCLECGSELPQSRRGALRPAVGIATTLAVLVGAASAGGYSILRHDRQPPPPATTVAQAPPTAPATTTPPVTGSAGLGSSSLGSSPSFASPSYSTTTTPPLASASRPTHYTSKPEIGKVGGASPSTHPTTHHPHTTTTPSSDGSLTESSPTHTTTTTTASKPQLALTNVALGAVAVAYAPYAPATLDLGDPSQVNDGTTRTAWHTPSFDDPTIRPQLGVYIDLATAQKLHRLVIETPTPGMGVEVYAATKGPPATITDPGWSHLATRRSLHRKTRIGLPSRPFRYVLVWITGLPAGAHRAAISELSLLSLQPE